MPTWYCDPKAALTFWRGCAHFLSSSVIIIERSSAAMRSDSPSKDNHSPSCLHFCLAPQKTWISQSSDQCPLGTRTRPATRHFFYTRPDSVSENPEATRILKYPVLSNIPGKSEVWGTPRHEKGNKKKAFFLTPLLSFNLMNTQKIRNVTGSTWEQSGRKCIIVASIQGCIREITEQ